QRASESVATVAAEWWTKHATGLRPRTRTKKRWVRDRYLLPALCERPIRSIEPPDVLAAAGARERRGRHESARYLVAVAGQIRRYAVATGRATRDATADLRGALTAPTVRHFAALTEPAKIGALLRDCDAY